MDVLVVKPAADHGPGEVAEGELGSDGGRCYGAGATRDAPLPDHVVDLLQTFGYSDLTSTER